MSVGALLHKWLPCFMPDVDFYLVKIHNVGHLSNKDISFGVCCSIWHFNLLKPSIEDFFPTVILVIISSLFKIRRENTSTDKKKCLKYGGVRNMKV